MAYRLEGNDPNRQTDYPTPAEVREMMTGASGPAGRSDDLEIVPDEEYPNVLHLERTFVEMTDRPRCATCGLIGYCWCQPGCQFCDYPPMRPAAREVS
jgi:hypothetical protein